MKQILGGLGGQSKFIHYFSSLAYSVSKIKFLVFSAFQNKRVHAKPSQHFHIKRKSLFSVLCSGGSQNPKPSYGERTLLFSSGSLTEVHQDNKGVLFFSHFFVLSMFLSFLETGNSNTQLHLVFVISVEVPNIVNGQRAT